MESGFGASTCTTVKHSFRKTSDTVFQKNITAPELKIPVLPWAHWKRGKLVLGVTGFWDAADKISYESWSFLFKENKTCKGNQWKIIFGSIASFK